MEGVEHFLYGVAIDEGYKGNRANSLTLDVFVSRGVRFEEITIAEL